MTGASTFTAIRASHIKPWRVSSSSERLDPLNGIPLLATLDSLFDAGLISFNDNGSILLSPELCAEDIELLDLRCMTIQKLLSQKTKDYLSFHRDSVYRE